MKHQPILVYLLFTLFLGLKLTGQIAWAWPWVFAPLWGYALLTFGVGFVAGFRRGMKAIILQEKLTNYQTRMQALTKKGAQPRERLKAENRPDLH